MSTSPEPITTQITPGEGLPNDLPPRVDDLAKRLESVSSFLQSGTVYHSGTVQLPAGGASIFYASSKGEGRLQVPGALAEEIECLTQACDPATFGRGQDDVLDESYRKAWKLDTKDFAFQFELPYTFCADIAALILGGLAKTFVLEFELYKLNVYGPGSFFKAHVDTPRQVNMIGSLVIVLPTEHEGGGLVLRHRGVERTVDSAKMVSLDPSSPLAAFMVFYSDIEHEVLPVTSGYRLTLTYNLYKVQNQHSLIPTLLSVNDNRHIGPTDGVGADSLKADIKAIIDNPHFLPKGGFFGFNLAHSCVTKLAPDKSWPSKIEGFVTSLKGVDAVLYRVLHDDLNLPCTFRILSPVEVDQDDFDSEGPYPAESPRFSDGRTIVYHTLSTYFGVVDDMFEQSLSNRIGGILVWDSGTGTNAKPLRQGEITFYPVVWVGKPHPLNQTEETYITYGNEHTTDTIYQQLCLVVEIERGKEIEG